MQRSKGFVRPQFQGLSSLEEAFHQAIGPRAMLLAPDIYALMREAFFAGAAALDSMQSEVFSQDNPNDDPDITAQKLAALMDKVSEEIRNR
jgi:hypothetical protein